MKHANAPTRKKIEVLIQLPGRDRTHLSRMATHDQISDSEDSGVELIQAPSTPAKKHAAKDSSPPVSTLSHRFRDLPQKSTGQQRASRDNSEDKIAVLVAGPSRPWEYQPYRGNTTVDSVLEELEGPNGQAWYLIEYEDGNKQKVSIERRLNMSFRISIFMGGFLGSYDYLFSAMLKQSRHICKCHLSLPILTRFIPFLSQAAVWQEFF